MKRILSLLLALTLLAAAGCSGRQPADNGHTDTPTDQPTPADQPAATGTKLGDTIADFTFTTYDGKTITLSEVLQEKELVVINLWATWCAPCRREFPSMEAAYQKYKDSVEILAVSSDPADTDEKIGAVASALGLTFPMGGDNGALAARFSVAAVPTTIAIDRFGTICLIEAGAQTEESSFIRLFEAFLGEDYTTSRIFKTFPAAKPTAPAYSSDELSAAVNGDGGALTVENDPNPYVWCMEPTEKEGRTVLAATNQKQASSACAVTAAVTADAGDVLAITFYLSSEEMGDFAVISVDGETVKVFSGEKAWISYAYAFETDGEHTVRISYEKNSAADSGEDTLWIDSVVLLTGGEAAAALAANEQYPVSAENTVTVLNEDAQEIIPEDPYGILSYNFGYVPRCYIIPEGEFSVSLGLREGIDPETAFCVDNNSRVLRSLAALFDGEDFVYTGTADSGQTTLWYYPDGVDAAAKVVLFFADAVSANNFFSTSVGGTWRYAEETAEYTLRFVDQDGNGVGGVTFQVCDEDTCTVYEADESGLCVLSLPPYAYEFHILKAPDGYSADESVLTAPENGGELIFTLTKQ